MALKKSVAPPCVSRCPLAFQPLCYRPLDAPFMAMLKEMGLAAIDSEIRQLRSASRPSGTRLAPVVLRARPRPAHTRACGHPGSPTFSCPSPFNEAEQFRYMLDFCATWLERRRDYELVQAYLDLFLQVRAATRCWGRLRPRRAVPCRAVNTPGPHLLCVAPLLQVHGDEIVHFPALLPFMERISQAHRGAWTHLDGLFQHALCLVSFFKSSVIA